MAKKFPETINIRLGVESCRIRNDFVCQLCCKVGAYEAFHVATLTERPNIERNCMKRVLKKILGGISPRIRREIEF